MVTRPPFSSPDPDVLAATEMASPKKAAPSAKARKTASAPKRAPAKSKTAVKKAPAKKAAPRRRAPAPKPPAPGAGTPIDPPPSKGWPEQKPGPVESAVRAELEELGLHRSAFAASARAMARNVDDAESPAGAASAARELRMVLPLAMTTRNPLSPSKGADDEEDDGRVVGPNRLDALRKKAAKRASS